MRFGVHEHTWQRFDQRTDWRRRTPRCTERFGETRNYEIMNLVLYYLLIGV